MQFWGGAIAFLLERLALPVEYANKQHECRAHRVEHQVLDADSRMARRDKSLVVHIMDLIQYHCSHERHQH